MTRHGELAHRHGDVNDDDDLVDRRRFRRAYLRANVFEALVAIAAVSTGLAFFLAPESLTNSAIAASTGPLVLAWGLLYAGGGLLVIAGLWASNPRLELAGLSALGASTAIDGIALVAERGPAGYRVALTYLAVAIACPIRARLVLKLTRVTAGPPRSGGDG